jgi:hypothetical protein
MKRNEQIFKFKIASLFLTEAFDIDEHQVEIEHLQDYSHQLNSIIVHQQLMLEAKDEIEYLYHQQILPKVLLHHQLIVFVQHHHLYIKKK